MAIARLVTRTPEFAQKLVRSLEAAGYSVEFASPDVVSHGALVGLPLGPADLEVDLDDPAAASSYLIGADGKEIPFAYDAGEREFVLAPAWRSLKAAFAPVLENFQRASARRREASTLEAERLEAARIENGRREYEQETARVEAARLEAHRLDLARAEAAHIEQQRLEVVRLEQQHADAARLPVPSEFSNAASDSDSAHPAPMPSVIEPAPVSSSLYLPEPTFFAIEAEPESQSVEFSGADYFDGQGARRLAERRASEMPSAIPQEAAPVQPRAETTPTRTPWLVTAALRIEELRTSVAANVRRHLSARHEGSNAPRLREYDAAWLRAVPVAAIITMAFLLGWASSNSQRTSPAPSALTTDSTAVDAIVNDVEKLHQASVAPVAPGISALSAAPVKSTPTRRASRKVAAYDEDAEDYDSAPDVVIRHYPAKNIRATQASAQRPPIKRISDRD